MGKILKSMIVLLAIVAMATPVIAADNLTLNGQMRVRAAYLDDGSDSTVTDLDHRFRVGGTFTVSEHISLTFRQDFMDADWGDFATGRGNEGSNQFDRAHMNLDFEQFSLSLGTQYFSLGKVAVDTNDTGIKLKFKGNVPVSLFYVLQDTHDDQDTHIYGANVAFSGFNIYAAGLHGHITKFSSHPFWNDDMEVYADVYLLGASGSFDLEGVKLTGEIDYFTGDAEADLFGGYDVDVEGLQGYVDAAFAVSEATTAGVTAYYAASTDFDDEYQATFFGNGFGGWDPLNHGPLQNANLQAYTLPYDVFNKEDIGYNAGVMAIQLYADFAASDDLAFKTSIAYAVPDEEDNTNDVDSALFLNLGLSYKILDNAQLLGQFQYVDYDMEDTDELISVGTALVVNF